MRKAFASVTFCLSTKTLIFTIPFNTPLQNACALPAATEQGIDWQPLLACPVKKTVKESSLCGAAALAQLSSGKKTQLPRLSQACRQQDLMRVRPSQLRHGRLGACCCAPAHSSKGVNWYMQGDVHRASSPPREGGHSRTQKMESPRGNPGDDPPSRSVSPAARGRARLRSRLGSHRAHPPGGGFSGAAQGRRRPRVQP
jgi:hypothetical protein